MNEQEDNREEGSNEELHYSILDEERCLCNEGITNGNEFDCACRIHKGGEENE